MHREVLQDRFQKIGQHIFWNWEKGGQPHMQTNAKKDNLPGEDHQEKQPQ